MAETEVTGRESLLPSAAAAIGHTPLVELSRITSGIDGRIFAKLEYLNPGHSKKDRIARQILEEARERGVLKPGQTVVEMTSGNTGTGLAIVCAVLGHPFVAVMSRGSTEERARMMGALGAEVVLVDQNPESVPGRVTGADLDLVRVETERIEKERGAFRADQFHNRSNFNAHYVHTGPEILEQSGGAFHAFCDFVGSGGTFGGCAAAFKEQDADIRCYVVEPAGAAVLAGQEATDPSHPIQGGGYGMSELDLIDPLYVDGFIQVRNDEAVDAARRLARTEGLFCGPSSGANVAAALKLLGSHHPGQTVVITLNDSGLKYLSTDLWSDMG